MSKLYVSFVAVVVIGSNAWCADLTFESKPHPENVFQVNSVDVADFSYAYMPYSVWLQKGSGKSFPMDVAPALTGLVSGKIQTPPVQQLRLSSYNDQAREFAEVLNDRNRNGRPTVDLEGKTPAQALKDVQGDTYVVELLFSTVIDRPFREIPMTAENISQLPEQIDGDHFHFQIPGTFVQQALEQGHAAFAYVQPNENYILSVFDLRDYNCAVMQDGIRDYFSREPEKDQLKNESIYVISHIDLNQAGDFTRAQTLFGKRPDAVIQQQVIYADHIIRAGETTFAFYAEGSHTRLVLMSNLAMKSKYFTGAKGMLIRQYLLDGITGGTLGSVTKHLVHAKDTVADLLSGANEDVEQKNECNRGLALGLIRYSQELFSKFTAVEDGSKFAQN